MFEVFMSMVKNPVVTLAFIFIMVRLFKPMRMSNTVIPSWSLTGLFCTTVVIFMVVIVDSINDTPNVSSQTTVASKAGATRISQLRRGSTAVSTAKVRSVVKEKYGILGTIWIGWLLLYVLGHKQGMWDMSLRFMMAIRGKHNPIPNDDPIDNYLVDLLKGDSSPESRGFAVQMTLARKGVVPVEDKKSEAPLPGADAPIDMSAPTGPSG